MSNAALNIPAGYLQDDRDFAARVLANSTNMPASSAKFWAALNQARRAVPDMRRAMRIAGGSPSVLAKAEASLAALETAALRIAEAFRTPPPYEI